MSEPNSSSDLTPDAPKTPSYTYGESAAAPAGPPAAPLAPPMYGERLPDPVGLPAYGSPGDAGPGYGAAPVKRRRIWDLVLTVALLVVGLIGMVIGLLYAAIFTNAELVQEIFDQAYRQYGFGGWNGSVGAAPAIIAISHIVLYLVALGVSVLLLFRNKVAFWVPLTAGVIAAIVFWGTVSAIVFSDPSLMTGTLP